MALRRTLKPLVLLILATLACGLPSSPGSAPPPSTEVAGPPGPTPEPVEPVALSLSRAITSGAADGQWTEAEGLVRALRFLAGELSAEEVFGDQPLMSAEGTRVVRRSQIYLEDPANTAERDELTRLLAILVPAREKLDRFSRPASAAGNAPGMARPRERRLGTQVECSTLWLGGFEPEEDGTDPICLEYDEIRVGGVAHRVYYPSYWEAAAPERALLQPTRDALQRSLEAYNGYGPRPVVGTDIVFTDLGAVDEGIPRDDVLAAADQILRANRCHVAVFPTGTYVALRDEAAGGSGGEAFGTLLQTIAHELFHCYQYTNLAEQESGPDGDAADWWIEGSAEYFGSVVYPSVNAEFGYLGALDSQSVTTSLIFMDYPAYAFFEYLDAQGGMGPQGIIENLLARMPRAGGYDEQQTAVAGVSGMAETFHNFGQAYLDKQLRDLGGGTLPVHPQTGDVSSFPIGAGEAHFAADPLVIHRYRLSFADNARFTVSREAQGDGRDSARPASAPGAWADIPPRLNTACDDSEYVLLFTSAVPPGADEVRLDLTTSGEEFEEEQPCDECLLGTWTLDNSSYLSHMGGVWTVIQGMLPSFGLDTSGAYSYPTDVFGLMQITFEGDGNARGTQAGWGIAGIAVGEDGEVHASMTYNGGGEAAWKIEEDEAADVRYLFFENGSFDLSGQMIFQTFPQRPIPFGESNDSVFLSTPQPFLCNDSTLTYYADDPLGPVLFHRGSGDLTP